MAFKLKHSKQGKIRGRIEKYVFPRDLRADIL